MHVEPRDCAIVEISTPVFTWRRPFDADLSVPYTFELRTASGSLVASRSTLTPRLFLADAPLAPGDYVWAVSYRNKKAATITSASRRFNVAAESVGVTLPSGASIADLAMGKPHPRALPAGASFADISAAALGGEYSAAFSAYMKAAATYRAQVPPEPPADLTRADFSSDLEFNTWKLQLARAAEKEHKAIETLGYAARFSGDTSYALAGVARLANLAAWPTRGATSEAGQDQANREIYVTLAVGLDQLQGNLTPAQTSSIGLALKDRLEQAYEKLASLDASPYQSHLLNSVKYIVTALLHSAGVTGFPEAKEWLRQAWDVWMTTATTWSADGGFADSTAYSWWTSISLAETATTVRLVTGLDLARWTGVGQFGNNMIALVSPAIDLSTPFGDSAETTTLYAANSWNSMRLYAALTRNPAHEWYWRAAPNNVDKAEPLTALHYMLLGLGLPSVASAAPAANSWVFEDVGVVALHSRTADPNRSSLFFRSSRIGSYNHSTADNNAFVFVSRGQPLFISGGYYPYFMSPHHALVGRATRFKNALTFDGGIGQAEPSSAPTGPGEPVHSMDARGQLINFGAPGAFEVTKGFPIAPESGLPDEYQARYSVSPASTQLVAVTVIREDCRSVPVNVSVSATSAAVTIDGAAPLVMDRRAVTVP